MSDTPKYALLLEALRVLEIRVRTLGPTHDDTLVALQRVLAEYAKI
jgi:hypothetical protein